MGFTANKSHWASPPLICKTVEGVCFAQGHAVSWWRTQALDFWVSALSTSACPWPKLISFKLPRPLVWRPMILSTGPFSYKQSFHGFVSLCHIKEHLRKTSHCALRMRRERLPSNQRRQDKLMVSGDSQLWWWLSVLPWAVSVFRAMVLVLFPPPTSRPLPRLFFESTWHLKCTQ